MMLTVQFAPIAPQLNPVQLADVYAPFRSEYPIFDQVQRAGPMPLVPSFIHFTPPISAPRNSFLTADRQFNLLFQEDRFSFGWSRLVPLDQPADYPGFETVFATAVNCWSRLNDELAKVGHQAEPIVGEIVYTNHFDMRDDASLKSPSSILNIFNLDYSSAPLSFNLQWQEAAGPSRSLVTEVVAPAVAVHGKVVMQMQNTARFALPGKWNGLHHAFDEAHATIGESFKRLINPAYRPI